jgi:hypothetical protein
VPDLCCGVGGPGRYLAAELGCRYLGWTTPRARKEIARRLTGTLSCRFEQLHVPPLPDRRC